MIPQLVLLYKRQKYESWAAVASFCMGAEGFVRCIPILISWPGIPRVKSPYIHATAVVQASIFIVGFMAVVASRLQGMQEQGLNESAAKPAFEEVWEAGKFEFQDDQKTKAGGGSSSKISV